MGLIFARIFIVLLGLGGTLSHAGTTVRDGAAVYERESGVAGNLSSSGSDTLANLMTLWTEGFKTYYPNVNIQVQASGSSTAPPALTEGTASIGPMSRKMKNKELESFERRHGYQPTAIPVALDALAVFVNKDNPLKGLSLPQIDAIFSSTRKCGYDEEITQWAQLGLKQPLARQRIQLYGRNSVSGTYGYFKKHVLCKGDFRNNVNEQPGSASVVQSVSTSLNAIGYSGIGYKTANVRAVPIAKADGDEFVSATRATAVSGAYPLARFLYIYVNKPPGEPLSPLIREFLSMVLSSDGQKTVAKDGYIPLPLPVLQRSLGMLD